MKLFRRCLLLGIFCLMLTAMAGCQETETAQQPSESQNSAQTGPVQETLSGTVYDGTMNTLTLITDDGTIYTFPKEEAVTHTTEDGIVIGYPVTIVYEGDLNQDDQIQSVTVESISVTNFDGMEPAEEARHLVLTMSTEEKVGQMFLARCPAEQAAELAAQYHLGGYILFGRDFQDKTKEEVVQAIQSDQDVSAIPMLIGVDEEGGTVCRVSRNPDLRASPFLSPKQLFQSGGWDAIRSDTQEKCDLLHELGINVNLAPVCDVCTDETAFMADRSFGQSAEQTAEYVETVVQIMKENQMGSVLKHFPGYGNNGDTHTEIVRDSRPYETFTDSDWLPFASGIQAGADTVLVSHNIVECMDPDRPASLSPAVHTLLRDKLGFDGVILTDDLSMAAITELAGEEDAAVQAVLAGNDMLCCTDFETQLPAVLKAVEAGTVPMEQVNTSARRILVWKINLGLLS